MNPSEISLSTIKYLALLQDSSGWPSFPPYASAQQLSGQNKINDLKENVLSYMGLVGR